MQLKNGQQLFNAIMSAWIKTSGECFQHLTANPALGPIQQKQGVTKEWVVSVYLNVN